MPKCIVYNIRLFRRRKSLRRCEFSILLLLLSLFYNLVIRPTRRADCDLVYYNMCIHTRYFWSVSTAMCGRAENGNDVCRHSPRRPENRNRSHTAQGRRAVSVASIHKLYGRGVPYPRPHPTIKVRAQ